VVNWIICWKIIVNHYDFYLLNLWNILSGGPGWSSATEILCLAISMNSRQNRHTRFLQPSTQVETDVAHEYFITKEQMDMYRGLYQQFFNGLLK